MSRFDKHVVINGTARSGTSWLAETFAAQYRYRLLFEPEHATQTLKGRLLCDQWVEHSPKLIDAKSYLKLVLQNRIDNDWIAQNSNRLFKMHLWPFLPKKYVVKFVRCNLIGNYLNKEFQVPVVHLLRNPYDVLNSQKRSSFPWLQDLSIFSEQPKLVNLIKSTYGLDISQTHNYSILERRAIRWCIENVLPLEHWRFQDNQLFHEVRYENLFSNMELFLELCKQIDLIPVDNIKERYRKPSTKTHKKSIIANKSNTKMELDNLEVESISKILTIFKTQLYPIQ